MRQQLLQAARELFAAHGYAAVSIRALADEAGVNSAMIHYYFGDKQGLYEAVLQETLAPMLERLRTWAETDDDESRSVRDFVAPYTRTLAFNPWIPALIMREVLSEKGRFRKRFIGKIARPAGEMLIRAIEREQDDGRIRSDIDSKLAALSLVSLSLFPFLALPIAQQVFGLKLQAKSLNRLVDHTVGVFLRGVGR